MIKINYQKHDKRKKQSKSFWLKVVADFNHGMSAAEISKKYKNPHTKKHYTREHIYWILKKLQLTYN
jgi:Mor family transcriptional regulator